MAFVHFILIVSLFSYPKIACAIPPPETIALLGGSALPPLLLIVSLLTLIFNFLWVKTKFFIVWRIYLPHLVVGLGVITGAALLFYSIYNLSQTQARNTAISPEEVAQWQKSTNPPLIVDIRGEKYYEHIHLLNALDITDKSKGAFFQNNINKNIVLYCKLGVQSKGYDWLPTTPITEKDLQGRTLYYLPGGLKALLSLGKQNPFPVVMNIFPEYANYLLKQPQFVLFTPPENLSLKQQIANYQSLVAKGDRPIMYPSVDHKQLAEYLSKLGIKEFIYIMPQTSKSLLVKQLLPPILIVFILLYLIRQREFYNLFTNPPTNYYQYLSTLLCILVTIPCFYFVIKFPIPFDFDLYAVNANLPINYLFLVMSYFFWSVCFFITLQFPRTMRLALLQHFILENITLNKQNNLILHLHSLRNLLITFLTVYVIYALEIPLQAVLFVAFFLLLPILIDCLFFAVQMVKPPSTLRLVTKNKWAKNHSEQTFFELDSHCEHSIGQIVARIGTQTMTVGLFSGLPLQNYPSDSFKKIKLQEHCQLIRHLLFLFQQDIKLSFNQNNCLVAIYLYHNSENPFIAYRHIFLMHAQFYSKEITSAHFDSERFHDDFDVPNPLMIDLLNRRWAKHGGCIKALRKLGYFIQSTPAAMQQFIGLSHRIYLDEQLEQSLFVAGTFQAYLRKKWVRIAAKLAFERLDYDFYGFILPRTELRLIKGIERLKQPITVNYLKRQIRRTLSSLCQSKWQCYSSLLHHHFYNEMHEKSQNLAASGFALPLPQLYSFTVSKPSNQHFNAEQIRFFTAETFRSKMRNLQLREWQYLGILLEHLKNKLNLRMSLDYLLIDDLNHLPRKRTALIELLQERQKQWNGQNTINFPLSFSLLDLEYDSFGAHFESKKTFLPLRVSGNQHKVVGIAVWFEPDLILQNLPKNSILLAENLSPEQILYCQHIRCIILSKGGALSHTSIIAREKNINLIIFYPIDTIKPHDRLIVEGSQVTTIQMHRLQWSFLDEMNDHSEIGNKAQRLKILEQNGYNIPYSFVLHHHSVQEISQTQDFNKLRDYAEDLQCLLNLINTSEHGFILRSSTNLEDTKNYSHAGLFYSNRIKNTDELLKSICCAWQKKEEVLKLLPDYSLRQQQLKHPLLFQPFIQGDCGGVLFTASNYPELMHVEYSISGAEEVVQGTQLHASFYLDENGQVHHQQGEKVTLSYNQLIKLYRMGHAIETLMGRPQDIEWILFKEQFYILQSRDITKLFN